MPSKLIDKYRNSPRGLKIVILYILIARVTIQVINLPWLLEDSVGSYIVGPFVISSSVNFVYQTLLIIFFFFALAEIFNKHNSYTILTTILSFRILERVTKVISIFISEEARTVFIKYNERVQPSFLQNGEFSENYLLLTDLAGVFIAVLISAAIITYLSRIKNKKCITMAST